MTPRSPPCGTTDAEDSNFTLTPRSPLHGGTTDAEDSNFSLTPRSPPYEGTDDEEEEKPASEEEYGRDGAIGESIQEEEEELDSTLIDDDDEYGKLYILVYPLSSPLT